jgi:hypothetical protein
LFHGCSFRFHLILQFQSLEAIAPKVSSDRKKPAQSIPKLGTSGKFRLACQRGQRREQQNRKKSMK